MCRHSTLFITIDCLLALLHGGILHFHIQFLADPSGPIDSILVVRIGCVWRLIFTHEAWGPRRPWRFIKIAITLHGGFFSKRSDHASGYGKAKVSPCTPLYVLHNVRAKSRHPRFATYHDNNKGTMNRYRHQNFRWQRCTSYYNKLDHKPVLRGCSLN